jgi:membrane protein DedA with SNARE-associated domain
MWEGLSAALLWFIEEWGEVAIFVIFLLEESGVPLPLPGDLALIWAGYRVSAGQSLFVVVLLGVEAATLLGASTLYCLALRGGRPLVVRYGRFLHLDEGKLMRAEGWIGRNATMTVLLGRIVPGFRIVTPLAAGVFRVPYRTFLPALAVGTFINTAFWITVGLYFGPGIIGVLHAPQLTARLAASAVVLAVLAAVTWQMRRSVLPRRRRAAFHVSRGRQVEAAALAGLLATVEMATALAVVLAILLELRFELPEQTLLRAIRLIAAGHETLLGPAFAPVAALLFFLAGILWAIPYAIWVEPLLRGPDWAKGAVFSLVPTIVSLVVVLPALGAGPLGLGLEAGLVPAAGEVVRHLMYGVALGLTYPMLLLARRSAGLERATGPTGPTGPAVARPAEPG